MLSRSALLLLSLSLSCAVPARADDDFWDRLRALLRRGPPPASGTPAPAPPYAPPPPPPPSAPTAVPKPDAVVKVVSWNLQTFGGKVKADRKAASARAIAAIFKDPQAKVFAAQELADESGAAGVQNELSADGRWTRSFENSSDSQDNGFFVKEGAVVDCSAFVFQDRSKSKHPARAAHVRVGDLDLTLVTVHLAYDHGQAARSADELDALLGWVEGYLRKPGADPDVLIAGDFNLPTRAGKAASRRAHDARWKPLEDTLERHAQLQFTALVDEPTSRQGEEAANNYDHFLASKHLVETAYVRGSAHRMPEEPIKAAEAAEGVRVSDHFPISLELRAAGAGIRPDGAGTCPF